MHIFNLVFVVFLFILSGLIWGVSSNSSHRSGWEWIIFTIFLMFIWLWFITDKIMHDFVNFSFVAYFLFIAGGCVLFIIYVVLETLTQKAGIWLFIRSLGAVVLGAGTILPIAFYIHLNISRGQSFSDTLRWLPVNVYGMDMYGALYRCRIG